MTLYDEEWSTELSGKEVDHGHLTSRLNALRDNKDVPLPNEGSARQRRIQNMEFELGEIVEFIADCDRWAEGTATIRTNRNDVPVMMTGYLTRARAKAVARGKELHAELQYIRAQTK